MLHALRGRLWALEIDMDAVDQAVAVVRALGHPTCFGYRTSAVDGGHECAVEWRGDVGAVELIFASHGRTAAATQTYVVCDSLADALAARIILDSPKPAGALIEQLA